MAEGVLQIDPIGAQIAASMPRYDPLAPERGAGARRGVFAISLIIHLILLVVFWDMLLGVIVEKEDTVVVKMIEEEEVPEPPKLRRKVLRQRVLDASVQLHKEIIQPEVVEVKPVPVLDQVQKVEVERTELTEAPKQIEQRKVVAENVSVFAERQVVQPVQIQQSTAKVTRVQASKPTAGPKRLQAAGPVTNARAVEVAAPTLTTGKLANSAIDGDVEGANVMDLESGADSRYLKGDGDRGALTGQEKDCQSDPVCIAYLEEIERRVYARWNVPQEFAGGLVKLRFRIDRGGSAHSIQVANSTDGSLGDTCLAAFRRASPFPPPPKAIHYIINKPISARFKANTLAGGGE